MVCTLIDHRNYDIKCSKLDVISVVDKQYRLWIIVVDLFVGLFVCFFTIITLTVLMFISVEFSQKIAHKRKKKTNCITIT